MKAAMEKCDKGTISTMVEAQRAFFKSNVTKSLAFRKQNLKQQQQFKMVRIYHFDSFLLRKSNNNESDF